MSKYVSPVPAKLQRGREILGPVIEDFKTRLAALEPDHPERPDVFLAWIIESAKSDPWRTSLEGLTNFIMAMNFASIDTTSIVSLLSAQAA